MKFLMSSAFVLFLAAFINKSDIKPIAIGSDMPLANTALTNVVTGTVQSLKSLKGKNGTLVIFSCNTCPFVVANQSRFANIQKLTYGYNVGLAVINSNEAKRTSDDSEASMKKYAADQNYTCAYLNDKKSVFADAFGATVTPEVFLFDQNDKLVYHGAIDDSPRDAEAVKQSFLAEALLALQEKTPIATQNTKGIGCSIKRSK